MLFPAAAAVFLFAGGWALALFAVCPKRLGCACVTLLVAVAGAFGISWFVSSNNEGSVLWAALLFLGVFVVVYHARRIIYGTSPHFAPPARPRSPDDDGPPPPASDELLQRILAQLATRDGAPPAAKQRKKKK